MGIFLSSVLALALAGQTSPGQQPVAPGPRERVLQDSTDGRAWLDLGRALVEQAGRYHRHDTAEADTAWARAVLDSADVAFATAARLLDDTPAADSASLLRLAARGQRALLAWELQGPSAVGATWRAGDGARLPPVLEELGENLLRGCPRAGVLVTAGLLDEAAVGYMRFVRGLRPDLLVVSLPAWRADTVYRRRLAGELGAHRLADTRPLCATMAFERPPALRREVRWHTRALLWVAGPRATADRVPPREFVFAALRLARDQDSPWLEPVLQVYRRAVRQSPALCEALRVYGLGPLAGCR